MQLITQLDPLEPVRINVPARDGAPGCACLSLATPI